MGNKPFQTIIKAQTDAIKSVTEQTKKQIRTITSAAENALRPEAAPKQTPPKAAGSGAESVKPPTYATPTAINRTDTQVTTPKPPSPPKVETITPKPPSYATPTQINRIDTQTAPRIGTGLRDLQARIAGGNAEDAYQAAEDAVKWGPQWLTAGGDELEGLYADFEVEPTMEKALLHDQRAETYQQELDAYRSLLEQYTAQHTTQGLQPILDQVKEEYDAAVKKNSATASPRSGVPAGLPQQDPMALFHQAFPSYQAAAREKRTAQAEEDEAFQRYRLWQDRYDAADDQERKTRREEELLAEVSTPEWDRRIRDMYAAPDKLGRVSEEDVYSQKVKIAKGMAVVTRDKAKARLDAAEEKLIEATSGDMVNPIDQGPEYLAASEEYWDAKAEYDEWDLRVIELSNLDYSARNRSAITRMKADPETGRTYVDAKTAQEDKDKLGEILDIYRRGGPTSQDETDRVNMLAGELERKYGLGHAAIIAYAGNMPPAPGAVSVPDVYERINAILDSGAQALSGREKPEGGSYNLEDMLDYERRLHSQALAAIAAKRQQEYAREHPGLASLGSVAATPFQVLDLPEMDWGSGEVGKAGYVPPDTSGMAISNYVSNTRGSISRDLELRYGKAEAFFYNTGLTLVDSVAAMGMFGPESIYIMGTNAAINGAKDIVARGGTARQALLGGLAAGVAETLFEKISVDRLLGLDLENVQSLAGAALGQAATEAGEETLTEIANIFFDAAIMGKNSHSARALEGYMAQGMSEAEARQKVFLDNVGQVALNAAAGAISGGVMSVGKLAVDAVSQSAAQSLSDAGKALIETIQGLGADTQKTASTGEAGSTYIDTDPTTHTPEQMAAIEEYRTSTDETLKEVFQRYLENPKQGFSRHNISSVSQRQAQDAHRLLGGDYTGYRNAINSNGVLHILYEHGPAGRKNQTMADLNDAARIGYVLDHYDDVEVVTYQSGDVDYSSEFRDKNNRPAPMLRFSKRVDGTYYVIEAVPEAQYKKFWVVSAYMEKADGGTQAPDAAGPGTTPDASLASSPSASGNIVPQTTPDVKPEGAGTGTASASPEAGLDKAQHRVKTAPTLQDQMLQILLQVNTEAWRKKPSTDGTPQSVLRQFKPLLEKNVNRLKCEALAKLLGRPDAAEDPDLAQFVSRQLADAEEYARLQTLDLSPQQREFLRPKLEAGEAAARWIVTYAQQAQQPGGDFGLQESGDGDTIIKMIKNYKKEGQNDAKGRQEDREKTSDGSADTRGCGSANGSSAEVSVERGPYTYTYRKVEGVQREPIQRLAERFKDWGIEVAIVDGNVSITKDGVTELRTIAEAATVNGGLVFINQHMTVEPENVLGHEAYHIWKGTASRNAYTDIVRDSIDFGSKAFQDYQSKIADAYLKDGIDLTDLVQVRKFEEELFAYISGQINDGGYEDILRPMFRDFEAVKAAWAKLLEEMLGR